MKNDFVRSMTIILSDKFLTTSFAFPQSSITGLTAITAPVSGVTALELASAFSTFLID